MDCNICLDKMRHLDLVRLLDCGHQFHNICFLRNEKATTCPMCRRFTEDTVTYCISNENVNFFELESYMFNEQIEQISINRDIIKQKEDVDNCEILQEQIIEQQNAMDKFFKEHLTIFKFKILKAVKTNTSCVDIYQCDYNDNYENYQVRFLLNCSQDNTKYFKNNGIITIVDNLYDYFSLQNVFVIPDEVKGRICIRVYV